MLTKMICNREVAMTILNKAKLRPDILALSERFQHSMLQGLCEFLQKEENQNFDFPEIWGRLLDGNTYFFEQRKIDNHLRNLLSYDERCFLARAFRFGTEYMAKCDQGRMSVMKDVTIEKRILEGIPVEWQIVPHAHPDRVLLYLHGGGWILGSPQEHRLLSIAIAKKIKQTAVSVDYRLAPENSHPAHIEDCVTIYKWLLANGTKAENIIIGGDSAGGYLTLATLLFLRDNALPLPAGAVLLAPATDLSLSDDLFFKNGETDPLLSDVGIFWWIASYLNGNDAKDPSVSPLFADLKGLPPLLFHVSECEMLYSDTTRLVEKARDAGVDVTIEVWDDMLHVFQAAGYGELAEAREALIKIKSFADNVFGD